MDIDQLKKTQRIFKEKSPVPLTTSLRVIDPRRANARQTTPQSYPKASATISQARADASVLLHFARVIWCRPPVMAQLKRVYASAVSGRSYYLRNVRSWRHILQPYKYTSTKARINIFERNLIIIITFAFIHSKPCIYTNEEGIYLRSKVIIYNNMI